MIGDTGSLEGMHAFIYCTKWRSGHVLPMPDRLTDSRLKDRATQLLIKYKSGALVPQIILFMVAIYVIVINVHKKCKMSNEKRQNGVNFLKNLKQVVKVPCN